MASNSYVLITPARNEEDYIEKTILSVISQTFLPLRWVIVSDGSTDRTDEIVDNYAQKYEFIDFLRNAKGEKNFGSKVLAFNAGYDTIKELEFSFIGNLDADVSFDESYFSSILSCFDANSKLGLAGGIITEYVKGKLVAQKTSPNSVAGAVQLFRRQCYEEIGGYIQMPFGGIDAAAEIQVRAKGWEVNTLVKYRVLHHRPVRTGRKSAVSTMFYRGVSYYQLGYHPLFLGLSSIMRFKERPYVIGGLSRIAGYCWAKMKKYDRKIPDSAVRYLQHEQLNRLKALSRFSAG